VERLEKKDGEEEPWIELVNLKKKKEEKEKKEGKREEGGENEKKK
jgi:hypothetical protein